MIIKTVKRKHSFTVLNTDVLENPDLSWKAKGILCYLLSRPPQWIVRVEDLVRRSSDGKSSVWAGLRELKDAGHAKMVPVRNKKGNQLIGRQWVIYEIPRKSVTQKTCVTENQHHSNTDTDTSYQSFSNTHRGGRPSTERNGFFKGSVEDEFIGKVVTKLEEHVRSINRLTHGDKIKRPLWCDQIRLLLRDIGGDKKRLKKVLKGYINTPSNDPYMPRADSAQSFRAKFFRIERQLAKVPPPEQKPEYIFEVEDEVVRR